MLIYCKSTVETTVTFLLSLAKLHVKSRDDLISGRRGDSGVLYSFIYKDDIADDLG